MLSTLLIPLDGSPLAEAALPYAEALARRSEGRLILLRAVEGAGDADADALAEAEGYLRTLADALVARGREVDISAPSGDVAELIVAEGEARNASLIVMGTHGRDGLERFFSGSIAEEVLQRTKRPLMLVRAVGDAPAADPFPTHARVLVPLDGSIFAETALALAHDLAGLLDGELVLLSVVTPPPPAAMGDLSLGGLPYVEFDLDEAQRESQAYLERIARQHGIDPATVQASVQTRGTAEGIVEAIGQLDAAVVVMATHARSGLSRIFFGSTATDTLHQITVPLILLHVDDAPELVGGEGGQEAAQPVTVSPTGLTGA